MTDELAAKERKKYARVYGAGLYPPDGSVGARAVPIAWGWMRGLGCASVTDWGCGHGRPMRWLRARGADAYGIDLVPTAATRDDPNFYPGTIWDPPAGLPPTEFAFSSDVLEHLPTERIEPTLASMAERTLVGGWLQIATIPDAKGAAIGETLHLTVRNGDWWQSRVEAHFEIASREDTDREVRLWIRTR